MVMPPLPALLSNPTDQISGYGTPVFSAILLDKSDQVFIFFFRLSQIKFTHEPFVILLPSPLFDPRDDISSLESTNLYSIPFR